MDYAKTFLLVASQTCRFTTSDKHTVLNDEEMAQVTALALYYSHAYSILMAGKTHINQFALKNKHGEISLVTDDTLLSARNPAIIPLLALESIHTISDLGTTIEQNDNELPVYDISHPLAQWQAYLASVPSNSVINCQEFATTIMHHMLRDLRYQTQLTATPTPV